MQKKQNSKLYNINFWQSVLRVCYQRFSKDPQEQKHQVKSAPGSSPVCRWVFAWLCQNWWNSLSPQLWSATMTYEYIKTCMRTWILNESMEMFLLYIPLPRHFWKSSVPVMLHPLCVDIRGFFFHGSLRRAVVARNTRVPRDFRTPTKPIRSKSVQSAPLLASCCTSRLQKSSEPGTVQEKCRPAKSHRNEIFIIVLRSYCLHQVSVDFLCPGLLR